MDMRMFALNILRNNPNVINNPNAQEMIRVIEQNDSAKGAQIASNICNTYGVSKEKAYSDALNYFGNFGMGR